MTIASIMTITFSLQICGSCWLHDVAKSVRSFWNRVYFFSLLLIIFLWFLNNKLFVRRHDFIVQGVPKICLPTSGHFRWNLMKRYQHQENIMRIFLTSKFVRLLLSKHDYHDGFRRHSAKCFKFAQKIQFL